MPGQTTCPLCQFDGDAQRDVYAHLLTSHRKSAISNVLLETPSPHADPQ